MITLNYRIHSGNVGSCFSNFDFKILFLVVKNMVSVFREVEKKEQEVHGFHMSENTSVMYRKNFKSKNIINESLSPR